MGIYLNFSHQDKYDDVIIGMKSTAIKFGDQTDLCLSCFATTMLSSLAYCGYQTGQTWPYYLSLGAYHQLNKQEDGGRSVSNYVARILYSTIVNTFVINTVATDVATSVFSLRVITAHRDFGHTQYQFHRRCWSPPCPPADNVGCEQQGGLRQKVHQ